MSILSTITPDIRMLNGEQEHIPHSGFIDNCLIRPVDCMKTIVAKSEHADGNV